MKPVIWLIGGTSEGRALIKALANFDVELFVSVATDYGAELIEKQDNLTVMAERMNLEKMREFIREHRPVCVVDATSLRCHCNCYGSGSLCFGKYQVPPFAPPRR